MKRRQRFHEAGKDGNLDGLCLQLGLLLCFFFFKLICVDLFLLPAKQKAHTVFWCCCLFVHSRNPLLEVRVRRSLCGHKSSKSVPLVCCWAGEVWKDSHSLSIRCISGGPSPRRSAQRARAVPANCFARCFFWWIESCLWKLELKTPQQKKTMDLSMTTTFFSIEICLMQ